jgi:hypothetical protein
MNIQYGHINWKLNPYLLVIIFVLFSDRLLLDFFIHPDEHSAGSRDYVTALAFLTSIIIFPQLNKFLKIWLFLVFLVLGFLFLESYYHYRTFTMYPHVFSKITQAFLVTFAYAFFRDSSKKYVRNIVYLIIVVFIAHLVFIKPYVFSFESFLDTERGVTAATLLLLVLPAIYLFNYYMAHGKMATLFLLLIVLVLILFLQHRSVWMATLTAFIINIILVKKKGDFSINFGSIAMIFLVPFVIGLIFSSLVLSKNPEVIEKFKQRVEDIHKVDEQGTGNWRLQQATAYWPFIQDHMVFGMRFKGFELPIQFYQEGTGNVYFEDRTGHHFHSFYIDSLFYLGLLGLLLKMLPMLYAITLGFKRPALDIPQISLIAFSAGFLIYGMAYTLPMYSYAFMGITLAHLFQNKKDHVIKSQEKEVLEQEVVSN